MRQGVSNIRRKMYITFSVSAPTVDDAVPKLARIENQISQILTSIGSKSHVLDGAERLALLNSQLNPLKPFNFDYRRDISARMVQTTKDCIAPMTLDFKPEGLADCFKTGDMWGQVLVIKKLGSELTDQALSDITELPIPLNVTWFAQPMDKAAAVAFTRQRLAWIDKEIIEEQRSAVQKGYDFSILPQELKYSKEETEDVIDNLQNKNQRLYVFTGLFYTYAPTKKQLDNQVLSIISAARQNSIEVSTYEYRQRQGFNSILPLGHNHCEISRMSTTAEVSILMPFATMELDDKGGNYYGQNKHSSFAQEYGLTDVLEINEWNPDSKPDYILSAFSGLVDKIDDLQGRIRPKADDVSIENFIYLNQVKADVPEPDQLAHAEENDHIFGLISKFAEGQDIAFVVQKVNFSGTKQIGEPEYELLPLGPTSGEDLADFTEWFMDDFKSGVDFGCDENREHLAMLAHTGFYREGEYVDQLLTFHQLDFSNAHAVTEKFSFEGRPESIQITCASNIRWMNMEHFAGAISTRRHTVISNTPHVSSTSATADFEKGSARMPAQPKTSLKAKSSISTTATSSRMQTDRIQRKSPQKGFGMNSEMSA